MLEASRRRADQDAIGLEAIGRPDPADAEQYFRFTRYLSMPASHQDRRRREMHGLSLLVMTYTAVDQMRAFADIARL